MKPLGGGHLLADWSRSFEYLLTKDEIHSIAVGMKSAAEVDSNAAFFKAGVICPTETNNPPVAH